MKDVLFIKTSSLGDVIHQMPAMTEARAHLPGVRFAWVVEEAFAPLARLHPAVNEVIPVAVRRWRKTLMAPSTWAQVSAFRRAVQARSFDEIVDTQGLLKSALIARLARGRRRGYDSKSIKEPLASRFYDVKHPVEWNQHAIARNRALTAAALGYACAGAPDFGLDRAALRAPSEKPYGVLLHATAQAGKEWPEENWRMFAVALGQSDIDLVALHGNDAERERAARIASASPRVRVPERQPLDQVARLIAGASFVVGVDTGLLHLAAALGVPLTAIFLGSEPKLTGPMGQGPIEVLGAKGSPPSVVEVTETVKRLAGLK
ncbi:lipopolysaccharide heptosyltransferase I [Rhodoplanes sp. Z2-YC6860]|uniref:lipopolysaccharide heptosyltransferase I n=1 Tax=Rhodoplanes sp. Z2-YC6860 TaxID=674703 RepID=UPI00078D7782|nr:lipopolysaccharide heptosyltransferase I [Rhodoplanes sp. Z2-YC6860]AMN43493.1 Lipopolysaccharide heptosyltransferase I [Rhodoplanes sp. Z2-YC6860]